MKMTRHVFDSGHVWWLDTRDENFTRKKIHEFLKLSKIFKNPIKLLGKGIFLDRISKPVGRFSVTIGRKILPSPREQKAKHAPENDINRVSSF